MEFRKAEERDLDRIAKMYADGVRSLREDGVDQWQGADDQPCREELMKILSEVYVLDDSGAVSTCRLMGHDPQYDVIYEGAWLMENARYFSIHRMATLEEEKGKGYAKALFEAVSRYGASLHLDSLRADTHKDNFRMQKLLREEGFQYCGRIQLANGDDRDAFEKLL